MLFDHIQSLPGFPRRYSISQDVPYTSWNSPSPPPSPSDISHSDLKGVTANQHHLKLHAGSHTAKGSDPLVLPFEFRDASDNVVAKIDANGNLFLKGRVLKI